MGARASAVGTRGPYESDDASFTWEHFASQVNSDLANTLGNFVNRVLTFSRKRFGDQVPEGKAPGDAERELGDQIAGLVLRYQDMLDELHFRKAAVALRSIWAAANVYLEKKAPWMEIREDPEAAALTLRTAMNLVFLFGLASEPIIPETSDTLRSIFDLQEGDPGFGVEWPTEESTRQLTWVPPGRPFTVPPVLFRKLTDDDVATWRDRFGVGAV